MTQRLPGTAEPPTAEGSLRPNGARVALAWIPVWALWSSALLANGVRWPVALREGAVTIGAAALLGAGAWRLAAALRWPERERLSFYGTHLLAAVGYALAWRSVSYGVAALRFGDAFPGAMVRSPTLAWELVMGAWLYGLVAGAFYVLQARELARREALRAARSETLAVEARLAALSAQLNPHFLFNALHGIGVLTRRDAPRAERAVELLGDLLRYSLEAHAPGAAARATSERVDLAREWRFTRSYLELQELRFGERLQVEAELEPEALALPVPSFLLQPLVENAVVHGIAGRPEGGRLRIAARRSGDALEVEVSDDGVGADPEAAAAEEGRGLGLLRRRLGALYGDRHRLSVETAPGRGFTVRVRLPVEAPA